MSQMLSNPYIINQIAQVSKSIHTIPVEDRIPMVTSELMELVYVITGVSPGRILERRRKTDQCFARQLCMYMLHTRNGIAKSHITKEVNITNHTTIMHGIKAIEIIKETKRHPQYRWVLECENFYY